MISDIVSPPAQLTTAAEPTNEQLLASLDELIGFLTASTKTFNEIRDLVSTDAFKYLSPERRQTLLTMLTTKADKVDDMARGVIKGMRRVKRIRLRDDDIIADLAHNWALTRSTKIGETND